MPRFRRRHHSKSRSRSRSHSHDRDREPKRRKIETYESPNHRKTVSPQPEVSHTEVDKEMNLSEDDCQIQSEGSSRSDHDVLKCPTSTDQTSETSSAEPDIVKPDSTSNDEHTFSETASTDAENSKESNEQDEEIQSSSFDEENSESPEQSEISQRANSPTESLESLEKANAESDVVSSTLSQPLSKTIESLKTPKKALSPKQVQKKLESEKKKAEKLREREEKEKKRQEEKHEKLKARQEKEEIKLKEKESKQKEKELKLKEKEDEKKRKREKEDTEKAKRLEREQEKLKKQQEIEEKNKKMEEKKQKAAAAFANFFVAAKKAIADESVEMKSGFMPFEIKSDMRLAPVCRRTLSDDDKLRFLQLFEGQSIVENKTYLSQLLSGTMQPLKNGKTWPSNDDEDVVVVDDANLGESIEEETRQRMGRMRAKFLKFDENQRPPYFGTWRKKSSKITGRRPCVQDETFLNYEIDSDDEWEEEVDGESLRGSDGEDDANDSAVDNEYEVDNQVFVQHGYLSEDEIDDQDEDVFDPETHKAKLKLLKNQFDEERKEKTQKLKPRLIGCIWMERCDNNLDDALRKHFEPYSIISAGTIAVSRRSKKSGDERECAEAVPHQKCRELEGVRLTDFLLYVDGNTRSRKQIVSEYLDKLKADLENGGGDTVQAIPTRIGLSRQMKRLAQWRKNPDLGKGKFCWCLQDDVLKEQRPAALEEGDAIGADDVMEQ